MQSLDFSSLFFFREKFIPPFLADSLFSPKARAHFGSLIWRFSFFFPGLFFYFFVRCTLRLLEFSERANLRLSLSLLRRENVLFIFILRKYYRSACVFSVLAYVYIYILHFQYIMLYFHQSSRSTSRRDFIQSYMKKVILSVVDFRFTFVWKCLFFLFHVLPTSPIVNFLRLRNRLNKLRFR